MRLIRDFGDKERLGSLYTYGCLGLSRFENPPITHVVVGERTRIQRDLTHIALHLPAKKGESIFDRGFNFAATSRAFEIADFLRGDGGAICHHSRGARWWIGRADVYVAFDYR